TPVAHRQPHGRLAVIVFADLTAVLPSHPYRMLPLLGKTRIIHNPRHHRTFAPRHWPDPRYMPRSASVGGLAWTGVIPRKQFYIKLFLFNTVILVFCPS